MRKLVLFAGAALLAAPLSIHAQGHGKGHGGQDIGNPGKNGGDNGGGPGKHGNGGGDKHMDRGGGPERGKAEHANRGEAFGREQAKGHGKRDFEAAGPARSQRAIERSAVTAVRVQVGRGRDLPIRIIENGRYGWSDPGFMGCPPGLAKKHNGCLPPGQARKLSGFDNGLMGLYRYSDWFGADPAFDWRYDRGYAYRVDPVSGLALSILPLLGGALFDGNEWPQTYVHYEVRPYYVRYYGYDDDYDYRYADRTVFAVDPETRVIQSIAALLTGDRWAIGSPMPAGYDLYNVPYDYRDRYVDSPSSWYRYDDGYVYEIEPRTQIVRQVIELRV